MPFKFNPLTGQLDLVNPALADTSYTGSDCTGNDGEPNRTLTVTKTGMIIVDGMTLHQTTDYTLSGFVITFLNTIYDTQVITIWS